MQETGSGRLAQRRRERAIERIRSAGRLGVELGGAAVPKRRNHVPIADRADPRKCAWYKHYVLDPTGQYRDATSRAGELFRRRFRVTWHIFQELVADANGHADFSRWREGAADVVETPCTPLVRPSRTSVFMSLFIYFMHLLIEFKL